MSEDKKDIFSKTNITVYVTKPKLLFYEEHCGQITGRDKKDIPKFADFIDLAVETALDNTEHMQKRVDSANEKVKSLEQELESLKSANAQITEKSNTLTAELEANLRTANDIINSQQAELNALQQGDNELHSTIAEITANNEELSKEVEELKIQLNSKLDLLPNQIVVTLNTFHEQLIDKYITNEKVISLFRENNKQGKTNGVYDVIDTEDKKQNIANLLTTVFIGSTMGKKIYPILTEKEIIKVVKKYLS